MDSLNLNKHISGQFNAELESIRTQVMTMGGMVEQQLSDAITAMHNQDSDLAQRVIEGAYWRRVGQNLPYCTGEILPAASAIAGKSGVAGPSYHPDAARRAGRVRADGH